jgi:hypothetical protein
VGTCADLDLVFGPVPDCRDDKPAWFWFWGSHAGKSSTLHLAASRASDAARPDESSISIPMPAYRLPSQVAGELQADVFVPRSTRGLASLLDHARVRLPTVGRRGVDLGATFMDDLGAPRPTHEVTNLIEQACQQRWSCRHHADGGMTGRSGCHWPSRPSGRGRPGFLG